MYFLTPVEDSAPSEAAAGKPETLNGDLDKVILLRWVEKLRLFRPHVMFDRDLRVDHSQG